MFIPVPGAKTFSAFPKCSLLQAIGAAPLKTDVKLISLLFLSSGAVTYVSTTTTHQLFQLTQLKGIVRDKLDLRKNIHRYYPLSTFNNIFFIIAKLPKNKPICLVETTPNKGIQYVRSTGSSASILKMDSRIGTALIKLPSGMKKVFSTYSAIAKRFPFEPKTLTCRVAFLAISLAGFV